MRFSFWWIAAVLAVPALAGAQGNRGQAAPVQVKTTLRDAKLTADFEARVGGLPAFINVFVDALYKELKAQ